MSNAVRSVPGTIVTESATEQTRLHGPYRLALSLPVDGGYRIGTYHNGAVENIEILSISTSDVDAANIIYKMIAEGGEKGVEPEGIRDAIREHLAAELAALMRRGPAWRGRQREYERLVFAFTAPEHLRRNEEIKEELNRARTMRDTVPAGRKPQVPATKRPRKLSPAQKRALAANINGIIYPGAGISRPTLNALAGQGFGTLHYQGSRKKILSLELNPGGREFGDRLAAEQFQAAVR